MERFFTQQSLLKDYVGPIDSQKAVVKIAQAWALWNVIKFGYSLLRSSFRASIKTHPGTKAFREASERSAFHPTEFEERFIATKEVLKGKEFDFIIVGAGSAGCVLARKLSENPNVRVLLVEAGGECQNAAATSTPSRVGSLWRSEVDWRYRSTPQPTLIPTGRIVDLENGKGLGGTSLMNYCMWVRGTKEDFDRWANEYKLGAEWSYEGVLNNFRNLESVCPATLDPSRAYKVSEERGTNGPLSLRTTYPASIEMETFIAGLNQIGVQSNTDYNSRKQEGCGYTQLSSFKGRRADSFSTFLEPILPLRKNLTIASEGLVRRVLIEGEATQGNLKATGIELELRNGEVIIIHANKEVILSSGAVGTPQLLMLSGIGDRSHLSKLGIETKIHISAVGNHLQDHPHAFIPNFVPLSMVPQMSKARLGLTAVPAVAFVKSPISENREKNLNNGQFKHSADIQLIQVSHVTATATSKGLLNQMEHKFRNIKKNPNSFLYRNILKLGDYFSTLPATQEKLNRMFSILVVNHAPQSRGSVRLASKNPHDLPLVDPGYLKDPSDIETLLWGVKLVRKLFQTPQMQPFIGDVNMTHVETKTRKGTQAFIEASDELLRNHIRATTGTTWHLSCSARMGSDDATDDECVCDNQLKVRHVKGLRIADCSVMPFIVSANTNASAMMIGDKCGELIYREYGF